MTWIMDRAFDDVAVWRTIWEQGEHLVCRISHTERLVEVEDAEGHWIAGHIQDARQRLRLMAKAQTEMVVRRGRQKKAKRQPVPVEIWACPIRLTYQTNVRREGPGKIVHVKHLGPTNGMFNANTHPRNDTVLGPLFRCQLTTPRFLLGLIGLDSPGSYP